ncbi:hypothetical protein B0H11DRAFT_2225317 [Mycena galericulata]|nr:hypothetical protein B0H11DRAFT_2225317 [Mycena galericulata]
MPKRKTRKKFGPDGDADYSTRRSAREKAATHRIASAKYYARNPQIRERNRIHWAEKRAAEKCNRRRWDPPKTLKAVLPPTEGPSEQPPEASEAETRTTPSYEPSFWDYRAQSHLQLHFASIGQSEEGAVGTAASPTSDERIAGEALAALAQSVGLSVFAPPPPPPAPSIDSVLELANQLSSLESSSVATFPLLPSKSPADIAGMGFLSRVQRAQMHVMSLNSGPLSPPTEEDVAAWRADPYIGGGGVDQDMHAVMTSWRLTVARAERRARIHGYEIRDGVILEPEVSISSIMWLLLLNGACFIATVLTRVLGPTVLMFPVVLYQLSYPSITDCMPYLITPNVHCV